MVQKKSNHIFKNYYPPIIMFLTALTFLMFLKCIMTVSDDIDDSNIEDLNNCKVGIINIDIDSLAFQELLKNFKKKGIESEKECSFLGIFGSDTIELDCGIRIHGGVSREYPKKSFRLYFRKDNLVSDNIFKYFPSTQVSSNSFSQIVLNAMAIDFSYIRNFLSMYITAKVGAITPRIGFIRLYINGGYYGLYNIIERVNDDMAINILEYNNYDLLKSRNHNGNLKTVNVYYKTNVSSQNTKDSLVPPDSGFEIKTGNTEALSNFVYWLESDSASYDEIKKRTSNSTLFGYFFGCYYTSDTDALSKNFYFLYGKSINTFELIRWDADAVFGRVWNGQQYKIESLSTQLKKNGLYAFLSQNSIWKNDLQQEYINTFRKTLSADSILSVIDRLEELLYDEVQDDHKKWKNILLDFFNNTKGWNFWNDNTSNPNIIWLEDLDLIREFVRGRETKIEEELMQWKISVQNSTYSITDNIESL